MYLEAAQCRNVAPAIMIILYQNSKTVIRFCSGENRIPFWEGSVELTLKLLTMQ